MNKKREKKRREEKKERLEENVQYLYHWSFNQFFLWIIFYYSNYLVDHLGTGYNFIILIILLF